MVGFLTPQKSCSKAGHSEPLVIRASRRQRGGRSCTWGPSGFHSGTPSQKENFILASSCMNWLSHIWERFCHGHIVTFFFTVCHLCLCVWCVSVYCICVHVCMQMSEFVCLWARGWHQPSSRSRSISLFSETDLAEPGAYQQQAAGIPQSPRPNVEVTGTNTTISASNKNTGPHACTPSTLPTEPPFPGPRFTHFFLK